MDRSITRFALSLMMLLAAAATAHGQDSTNVIFPDVVPAASGPTLLPAGTRVRVTQGELRPRHLVGPLRLADSAEVSVGRSGRDAWTVSADAVERVETSAGRRSGSEGVIHGAGRGLLVGAVAGATLLVAGALADQGDHCGECFINGKGLAVLAAVPLAGLTTLVGGLVGGMHPGERWSRVRGPVRTAPASQPAAGTR